MAIYATDAAHINASAGGSMTVGVLGGTKIKRTPEFQCAMKRIAGLRDRLSQISCMSDGLANRIVGTLPGKTEDSASDRPGTNGAISELQNMIGDLEALAEDTYRHVSRISSAF